MEDFFMKPASEYRREAREKLIGNFGWAILVLFVCPGQAIL